MSKKGLYCVLGTIVFLATKKDTHSKSTLLFLDKFPLSPYSPLKPLHIPLFSIFYSQIVKIYHRETKLAKKGLYGVLEDIAF